MIGSSLPIMCDTARWWLPSLLPLPLPLPPPAGRSNSTLARGRCRGEGEAAGSRMEGRGGGEHCDGGARGAAPARELALPGSDSSCSATDRSASWCSRIPPLLREVRCRGRFGGEEMTRGGLGSR